MALSLKSAEKLLAAGAAARDDGLEIVGYRAAVGSYYWLGDFIAARRQGDALHAMYDPRRHWHIAQLTNTDPLTGDGIYRGQYLWMLGYPDQARAASDEKDEHARRRNHPFDLAFALTLGAQVFDYLGEPEELLRRTEEAERICRGPRRCAAGGDHGRDQPRHRLAAGGPRGRQRRAARQGDRAA